MMIALLLQEDLCLGKLDPNLVFSQIRHRLLKSSEERPKKIMANEFFWGF